VIAAPAEFGADRGGTSPGREWMIAAMKPGMIGLVEPLEIPSNQGLGEQVIWPVSRRGPSTALWSLLKADGASGSSLRRVQGHGGPYERPQRLFIDFVALMEIDGTPGVAFEAGVEEA
jgi:hypothetical protein